jgi:hypothetical protein
MEYVPKINIFGLKMMVKTEKWSRKNIYEIPPCAKPFSENLFYFIEIETLSHKYHPYSILSTQTKYESLAY